MALGEFEQLVLFALLRLGEAHGPEIAEELEERAARQTTPGALYIVLERLEAKGYVESWIGDSTPDRGGRRRKVYRLLPDGARELQEAYERIQKLASGTMARMKELIEERG